MDKTHLDNQQHSNYADYHHYIEEQVLDINNMMNGLQSGRDPNGLVGVDGIDTDEDAIERKKILNLIYANDYKGLKDLKITNKDLNWRDRH